jgi:hypothetical protein
MMTMLQTSTDWQTVTDEAEEALQIVHLFMRENRDLSTPVAAAIFSALMQRKALQELCASVDRLADALNKG